MPRPFPLPGATPHYAPDRSVDVKHIRLELRLDVESRRIDGSCATTIAPILEEVRTLELDAVELAIRAVRLEDGPSLRHAYDGRRLRIELATPLAPGQLATVIVDYAATPRRGLYFVGPDESYPNRPRQLWTQGQDEDSRYWFPCVDAPHEKATSEVVATVPAGLFVISNGELVAVREVDDGARRTFHYRLDVPHSCYLVTLAAGQFARLEDRWQDVTVRYFVEQGREQEARRTLGRTPDMLALFSSRFGLKYPFRGYAQVAVAEFIFGGMENTTAATITDAVLLDERAALDYDAEDLVAHELAHQWFGDLVTCRDWSQGWLNEGFATYAEYIWREHAHGADEAGLALAAMAQAYFGEDQSRYRRPIVTNVYDEPISLFDRHLYSKGGCVLHMLRRLLGEEAFWPTIAHYVRAHQAGSVETRDLARAVSETTGRNIDWFLEQWVLHAGHPELAISYAWDPAARLARLTVEQTQKVEGETPLFRLPTLVRFRTGERDVDRAIDVREAHQVFYFPLAEEPTQVIFDPGQHLLKQAKIDKPRTLWLAEVAFATESMDRIAAARALAKDGAPDAIAALRGALLDQGFWGVQAAAAEALGSIRTAMALEALLAAIGQPHPKTRRAVIKALGEFRFDARAAGALARAVETGDPSCFVEAEACLALGRTRSPRAAQVLRSALGRDSWQDIIRQHVYRGLAEARDETSLPLLIEAIGDGRPSPSRRAAALALAKLVGGGRVDRDAREVRERVEHLLEDPDFRVKMASLEAIAELADPRSLPALRRVVERDLDGRMRRRAREISRDLEEGRTREEAVRTLRDEVERLRRDLTGLRERIDKVEAMKGAPPPQGEPAPTATAAPAALPAPAVSRSAKTTTKPPRKPARTAKSSRATRPRR